MGTDFELLDAWRAGDLAAGNALLDRHFDRLFRFFAYKLPDQAEDLVQQTLLACVGAKDDFRKDAEFRTFVFRIARNTLYDALVARNRERPVDPMVLSVVDQGESPSRLIAEDQDLHVLVQALRRLPVELQILVELRFFEGLTGPQLAEVLELPQGTIRSRLRRAVGRLRELVDELGASPEAVQPTVTRLQTWAKRVREAAGRDDPAAG